MPRRAKESTARNDAVTDDWTQPAPAQRRGRPPKKHVDAAASGGAPKEFSPFQGWEDLPPPGDERREVLKKRHDQLTKAGALLASQLEQEKVDPEKVKPDYNVRSEAYANKDGNVRADARLKVTNAQPGFKYAWIHRDRYGNTGDAQTLMMEELGWEIVRGDMPEARERMAATGERHLIDTHLMRIPVEVDDENQRRNRRYRAWRETGISQELLESVEKHGGNVWDLNNAPDSVRQAMTARLSSRGVNSALNVVAAKNLAMRNLDRHLRAGTLPGLAMRR